MIKAETKKIIRDLARKYNLKLVMLFGSVAKNRENQKSDIDLAILADNNFYRKHFSDFNYELLKAEQIERKDIEIVPITSYNPLLLFSIFSEGILIFARSIEDYWKIKNWARVCYEDQKKFFIGREDFLAKKLKNL